MCPRLNALVTRLFDFKPSHLKWVRLCRMLLFLLGLAHVLGCVFWIIGCDTLGMPRTDGWISAQNLQDEESVIRRHVLIVTYSMSCCDLAFRSGFWDECM